MKRIYLDNAAITPVDKKVLKEMVKYSKPEFANPSSLHVEGVNAKKVVNGARKQIADLIHGHADEIVFTGTGTEANNIAINGLIVWLAAEQKIGTKPLHMITSVVEHPSVLECAKWLEGQGVAVDYVGVDEKGILNLKELKEKIRPNTCLVSIMTVNNEIGTIQPITEIAKTVRAARKTNTIAQALAERGAKDTELFAFPYFHTDASQAPLFLNLDTRIMGVDLITFDGQKIYGPRGIGALWVRRGIPLATITRGGGQEKGIRSGTENVAAIAGLAKAFELAAENREKESVRLTELRDYFISELMKLSSKYNQKIVLNGDQQERIPNNINVSFLGLDNEFLLLQLDAKGIACSTKSSCMRDENESYVLAALGLPVDIARTSLRFSLGKDTKKRHLDFVLKKLATIFEKTQ